MYNEEVQHWNMNDESEAIAEIIDLNEKVHGTERRTYGECTSICLDSLIRRLVLELLYTSCELSANIPRQATLPLRS